jgi:hypothetical protein
MKILWGCEVNWLPIRFYFFLSDDKNLKRIYFCDYLDKIYYLLFKSEKREKQRFCFKILDIDSDSIIGGSDFMFHQNNLNQ